MPDEKKDPALASFAQQVMALREGRTPTKVGVMIPTYMRPDLLRACVLQFAVQTRKPDLICVHQNGVSDSYRWALEDLAGATPPVAWLHTAVQLPQHQWYSIPLRHLVEQGCSHIFWADPGDLYLRTHIEKGLDDLKDCDFSVSSRGALLVTAPGEYRYSAQVDAQARSSLSTSCFTRRFAGQLLDDIEADKDHIYTADVVLEVTCPKFRCRPSQRATAIRHGYIHSNQ